MTGKMVGKTGNVVANTGNMVPNTGNVPGETGNIVGNTGDVVGNTGKLLFTRGYAFFQLARHHRSMDILVRNVGIRSLGSGSASRPRVGQIDGRIAALHDHADLDLGWLIPIERAAREQRLRLIDAVRPLRDHWLRFDRRRARWPAPRSRVR